MVRIHRRLTLPVPVAVAFSYVTDLTQLPEWMYGIQSIHAVSDIKSGLGARYEVAIKLGATLRSTIEVTAHQQDRLFTTESRSGVVNQSTWSLKAISDERTELQTTMDYQLPGGLAGRALAKAIEPFITIAITSSETNLYNVLETRYQNTKQQQQ